MDLGYPFPRRAANEVIDRIDLVQATPGVTAPFASVIQRRVERGGNVEVRYAAPRGEGVDTLAIVRTGGRSADAIMTLPPQEASFFGSVRFGSGALRPGRSDALVTRGNRVVSRSTFWVVRPDAQATVAAPRRIRAGRPIRVSRGNAPAFRRDWVGIRKAGDVHRRPPLISRCA